MKYNWFSIASGQKEPLKGLFQQTLLPNITLVLVLISRMNNHCLQQQSVNSARTENILNLTIRTWWLRSWSVKTFSKSICLARQLKYYLPSLVTISISQILGDILEPFSKLPVISLKNLHTLFFSWRMDGRRYVALERIHSVLRKIHVFAVPGLHYRAQRSLIWWHTVHNISSVR